ncbi:transcriptional regulator of heat shock response [Virgibacillus natechei]|uniref:Transcriptional regulator of heat shock response n=1 Tax=Virgibacillus natechei TaxID=1216297 RepID=A0ABS4IBR2_9BACI|nr:hypothetical protein [Virgibacillus natechei]MBP1968373.1 transcriptional regulator of heat shock response [Virgibacillus natechei]UZD13503.1 hypothetical protein OLD84_02790 [Virgibacillus natechei]
MSIVVLLGSSHSFASEKSDENNEGANETFSDFMDEVFNDLDGLMVKAPDNSNVTEEFIEEATDYYKQENYKEIKNIIADQNLSASHKSTTEMNDTEVEKFIEDNKEAIYESIDDSKTKEHMAKLMNNNSADNNINVVIGRDIEQSFYHLETESTLNRFTDEWVTTLSGSYLYDTITREKFGVAGPQVNFDASFGALFSPSINNVVGGNSIINNNVQLSARYDVTADIGFSVGDLPLGFPLNYGNHTDSHIFYLD